MPRSGSIRRRFARCCDLLRDERFWVKVSGMDRITRAGPPYADAQPFAQVLVAEFGDRVVWGNDWPHPNHAGPVPDEQQLVDLIATIAPSEADRAAADGRQPATPLPLRRQRMKPRFENKVAIVTGAGCVGAGWGNGRAIAVRLARRRRRRCSQWIATRPGSRRRSDLAGDARASIKPWACDVTSSESVAAMAAACVEAFGTIDILVNNVGGSAAGGPVEMAEDVWDSQIDVNLKSVFLTCKHVLPTMLAQARRRHRQHRLHLGPALDRQRAGGLCGDEGRRDPVFRVWSRCSTPRKASASTAWCRASCTRRWWRRGWPSSARAVTSMRCLPSGRSASRSASWATDATPRARCCSSPATRPNSSPGTELVVDGGMTARCD